MLVNYGASLLFSIQMMYAPENHFCVRKPPVTGEFIVYTAIPERL